MLRPLSKLLLISLLILSAINQTWSQAQDNSPFSRFGLGDFAEPDMPSSHSLGGLSAVYHDFFEANLENPASLGFLQYTSFQMGVFIKNANVKRFGESQRVWSGNMDHLSLNIPLINPLNEALERRETDFSWGTSVSFRPYSHVGYDIAIKEAIPNIGLVERSFTGSGGLYQITFGNGIKYKNLAAGVNLGFIYGKPTFEEETTFKELGNAYRSYFRTTNYYSGFRYRLGLIYEHPLDLAEARKHNDNPSRLLSFGVFMSGESTLDTKSDVLKLSINDAITDIDTAITVEDQPGEAILPVTWGAGIMYRQSSDFRFGADVQFSSWSEYMNTARPDEMKNTFRVGAGFGWIPDANSYASYFKRVEYRVGFYALSDPRVIEGSQVKASALTVGAGLPLILQRNIAWIQLGLDIGKRTGGDNLSENFCRAKVGFIFNDNSWFIKGKYN